MKNLFVTLLFSIVIIALTSCEEKITDRYLVNSPVYMNKKEFRSAVKTTASQEISQPGKIYFKDNMIFINESLKGIHVIDNADPASPEFVAFIEIPGNTDMAIKDSILYADSFTDLVALNINDIHSIHEVGRIDSIFPYALPPLDEANGLPFETVDQSKGIVVGWETKEITEKVETGNDGMVFFERADLFNSLSTEKANYTTSGNGSVGVGGSMARFTIADNFLYTVDNTTLKSFDIDDLSHPLMVFSQNIGWNVETIFQYTGKLFFGTQTGMLIYDISIPSNPVYISTYSHLRRCDPVVVNGNFAYVTLRAGNLCGEATSQLDVINISNLQNPKWEQSYPMQEPYGLGIDENTLFVCDGPAGLKVYNATDPKNLVKIAWFSEVNAFDVIPYNGILMMIGTDGLYQYDYSGDSDISLLSQITITPHE